MEQKIRYPNLLDNKMKNGTIWYIQSDFY